MVVCIVVGCWRKSEKKNTEGFLRMPSFVKNQGEEFEETTTERRNLWISAVSRDDDQETWSWRIMKDLIVADRINTKSFHTSLFS